MIGSDRSRTRISAADGPVNRREAEADGEPEGLFMGHEPLLTRSANVGGHSDTDDQERVLVAVVPSMRDWELARDEHWYRIPVSRAPRRVGAEYLAFYHTSAFGELRWCIAYYAPVRQYRLARRHELFPDEPDHPRADELYYRIEIGPLVALPKPIPSVRLRRITFIATTLPRLLAASEVNDLWSRETARDRLWRALRAREIPARRDYAIKEDECAYRADLAVLCTGPSLAIECVEVSDELIGAEPDLCGRRTPVPLLPGWTTWRLRVSAVMGDLGTYVELIGRYVAENGGPRLPQPRAQR